MTIKEVGNKMQKSISGNGMYLMLGGGALILIFYLLSKSSESDTSNLTVSTGYSAYPDTVTNANVIIDEVNTNVANEISQLKELLNDQTELMQDGDNAVLEKIDTSTDSITDKIATSTENLMNKSTENTDSILNMIDKNTNEITTGIDSLSSQVGAVSSQVANTSSKVSTVNNTVNKTYQTLKQKSTATSTSSASKTASKTVKYFNKITSYKGNSFVDALKKRGVNSSLSYRKKIAKANGIKNYTGTASQNTKLLNLMKKGKLIKP